MRVMAHRTLLLAVATVATALAASAPASGKVIEVGRSDAAPACPASPCLAVSRTTGYQIKVGDDRGAFTVPEDGKIVAWSIALGTQTAQLALKDVTQYRCLYKARLTYSATLITRPAATRAASAGT